MAGYTLDGTPTVDYATLSFIAPAWCLLQARAPAPTPPPPIAFGIAMGAERCGLPRSVACAAAVEV